MELPSDALDQVRGLEDNLLHATQMALSEVAVISPLRINREMVRSVSLFLYVPSLLFVSVYRRNKRSV